MNPLGSIPRELATLEDIASNISLRKPCASNSVRGIGENLLASTSMIVAVLIFLSFLSSPIF
jgi:hypothetical protein